MSGFKKTVQGDNKEIQKKDLDSPENIRQFVKVFYERMLDDAMLKPIFIDVAEIDLPNHMDIICSYWEKLLLGRKGYQRHTMNIHRAVHTQQTFTAENFQRWFQLFSRTADDFFVGEKTEQAKRIAHNIVQNMYASLLPDNPALDLSNL